MFRGVSALALDGKGRLAIPARHRERIMELSEGQMVVTVDRDYCLLLYPLPEWESLERKLTQLSSLNPTIRRLQRLYIGHATDVDMDGSGRILLPPPLREFAGLDRRTVLLVTHDPLEALRLGHRIRVLAGRPARLDDSVAAPPGAPPRPADRVADRQGMLLDRLAAAKQAQREAGDA